MSLPDSGDKRVPLHGVGEILLDRQPDECDCEALEASGRLKGGFHAMKDTISRELGEGYLSEEMQEVLFSAFDDLEEHLGECFDVGSETRELPERPE